MCTWSSRLVSNALAHGNGITRVALGLRRLVVMRTQILSDLFAATDILARPRRVAVKTAFRSSSPPAFRLALADFGREDLASVVNRSSLPT